MTWMACLALAVLQTSPAAQTSSPQPAAGNPVVVVETSAGSITIELFKEQAPVSVENFLHYVTDGFYPGTIFHRVVPGYVIQGGGYTEDMTEKRTRPPIQNEADNKISTAAGRSRWRARARFEAERRSSSSISRTTPRSISPAILRRSSGMRCSAGSLPAWTSSTALAPHRRRTGAEWRTCRLHR